MEDPTIDITTTPVNKVDGIQIMGAVEGYDIKKVSTRADGEDDSHISEMTMFIFDANNKLVQGWKARTVNAVDDAGLPTDVTFADADKCSSAINIHKDNPTFVIDTKNGLLTSLDDDSPSVIFYDNLSNTNDLTACKIYIVANAWHALKDILDNIEDLADLEAVTLDIDDTLAMPKDEEGKYIGFPMIGTHLGYANEGIETFDLRKVGDNSGAVAKIPLKKVYAKVNFTMQINAIQTVVNQIPTFEIEKVEVFNVPNKARLGRELDTNGKPVYKADNSDDYITELAGGTITAENISDYYHESPLVITDFSRKKISHTPAQKPADDYLIEFGFYMPEHKVTPNADRTTYTGYPDNIPDDLKQYYKPCLVGATRNEDGTTSLAQIATFVRIHGTYTDHNAEIKTVRYDIYLGQDNTDSFTIKRNQLLNNKLVITGLTNYYDAYPDVEENISIDHRVDVDDKGYILSMERTAILDAHFEVRPLDIQLSKGGSMTITIPESYRSWVAMESDSSARETNDNNTYVNITEPRKGVRKYFTDGLVSTLNSTEGGNGGTITIKQEGDVYIYRVWFYIDENPNVYDELLADGTIKSSPTDGYDVNGSADTTDDDMYRVCPVQFAYSNTTTDDNGNSIPVSKSAVVNFQQYNLWRVWNKDGNRYYDIEHEEEYLNNYVSDAQYGSSKNGMPWGLNELLLSHNIKASYVETSGSILGFLINLFGGSYDSWINSMIEESGIAPYYDFYLERDTRPENVGFRNFSGRVFNSEIIATLNNLYSNSTDQTFKKSIQVEGLLLTDKPQSAIAYCYHKNKRDKDGNVATVNWYLPAIDEIEEISMGAYDRFDKVFQNQKYWSCQPSAFNKILRVERERFLIGGNEVQNGTYMDDDVYRARATSVSYDPTNPKANANGYVNISSATDGVEGTFTLHFTSGGKFVANESGYAKNTGSNQTSYTNHPGNLSRTDICRIRAVYRSGNVE